MCSRCTQRDIATAFDFITILFASGGLGTRLGSECRAPVGTVDFRHQLRGECEWLGYEGGRPHDSVLVRYGLLRNIRSYPCIVVTAAPCWRAECLAPTSPISADIGNRGESIFLSRTILQRHDSTWWKPDVLDVTSFDVRDHLAALRGIKAYLAELPSASTVVIKHIVPLTELWFEAMRDAGFHVAVVIAGRHPRVIDCVRTAGIAPELAIARGLEASLVAERKT